MKSEHMRLQHEQTSMKEKIKDNKEKIKMNKQLPYLVGNIVEVCVTHFSMYLLWYVPQGMRYVYGLFSRLF